MTWLGVCLVCAWLPSGWLWPLVGGWLTVLAVACCISSLRKHHALLLILVTAMAAACSFAYEETVRYQPLTAYDGREVTIRAEVGKAGIDTVLRVTGGELPPGTRLLLAYEPPSASLEKHDMVEATFTVSVFDEKGLRRLQTKAGGIWLAAHPADLSAEGWYIEEGSPTAFRSVADVRDQLAESVQDVLPADIGAVVTGICLGADDYLSQGAKDTFRSCGVSHLFAVSGLHLSVLTAAFLKLLRRFRLPRLVRSVILVAAVVGFAILVGAAPSVVRAGVMCVLVTVALCVRRQVDARNSLGLALFLLLAADPFAAYDAGLLLSFCATFGLLFLAPKLQGRMVRLPMPDRWRWVGKRMAEVVSVTLAATLATLPVSVVYFGSVSLVSVIGNLLMTLPASLLLIVGFVAMITMLMGLWFAAYPLLWVVGWLSKLLLWTAQIVSALPFAVVSVRSHYLMVWIFGSLALGVIGYLLFYRRGVVTAAVCSAVILCVMAVVYPLRVKDTVRIDTCSAGEDIVVCVRYEGHTALITAPTELRTLYEASELLWREGVTKTELLFIPTGNEQVLMYLPLILGDYTVGSTVCYPSDETVPLWDIGTAVWNEKGLCLTFGERRIVLDAGNGQELIGADCVISADAVVIYQNGEPYVIPGDDGEFPSLNIKDDTLFIR